MATILVIDDDEQVRSLLNAVLTRAGYEVLVAENGNVGMRKYNQQPVDIVITDILMPEKEGLETIIELRRMNPNVKIIAISGGGARKMDFLSSADLLGAAVTFAKPVERSALLQAIVKLLAERN